MTWVSSSTACVEERCPAGEAMSHSPGELQTLASSHGLAGMGTWIVRMSTQWEREQKVTEFTDVGVLFCFRIWNVARTHEASSKILLNDGIPLNEAGSTTALQSTEGQKARGVVC